MNENLVIDWLKRYFDKPELNEQELKPVLHFSLLWNLFEHTYFTDNKHLNPKRLLDLSDISFNIIQEANLNEIFDYFKVRYFPNNHIDNRFTTLLLDRTVRNRETPSNYNFCQTTLNATNPTQIDKARTVFLIIHRFRNNLFHGRKNPETLNIYQQPFNEINKFLVHFIEATADNNAINNNRQIQ
jgi:hypothetical protein